MSKKKSAPKQTTPTKKNNNSKSSHSGARGSKTPWIIAVVVLVVVASIYAASRGTSGAGTASSSTPTPEEARYIGRFLPAGYEAPRLGQGGAVTSDRPMAPVTAIVGDTGPSVPVADIESNRNVGFEYSKADGSVISLLAYVKPSGELFVGVSYCVPCQGTGQTLTSDGMLTCDSCGTKRDSESGVGISGACKLYPLDELPSKIEGDRLIVDKAALEGWTVQPTDRVVGG